MNLRRLQFPIGEFAKPTNIDSTTINQWIEEIENFPARLNELTSNLTKEQLNWKYRPKGWSIKQVVHHCADSHMNSLIRFKLALTEDSPTIRPYHEDKWAELIDSQDDRILDSILLLIALHSRWVKILRNLTVEDLKKEFVHPEHGTKTSLEENIGIYAWHCNHHFAHIELAIEAAGKYNKETCIVM